jgi:hypothetical protein
MMIVTDASIISNYFAPFVDISIINLGPVFASEIFWKTIDIRDRYTNVICFKIAIRCKYFFHFDFEPLELVVNEHYL